MNIKKFKNIPFIWEGENYLLKMKEDCAFLQKSNFKSLFNFSEKSDPFLVFPSMKNTKIVAQGGGAHGL